MNKSIFFVTIFLILNGCAQYSSIVGPTYTMAKSGSVLQTANAMFVSYGVKKTTGKSTGEHINSLVKKNYQINSFFNENENIRKCQTTHSSSLSEIFFETLDGLDCFRDPFSTILR